ncbi:hypothetical protein PsorP6_014360 [Peronosclerospora sorghi]|uniref:Uncharacterized protein n=1 Tax=Peronosclerospora sorghi TaxID=230839 RepID=A0ACC0VI03_9STRA|nr:hypothetical protein PsorP6_014360 [Peronosclerospora sorghi]
MSSTLASGLRENEIQALQANSSSMRNELERLRDEKTSLENELAQLASSVEQYENELPKIKLDISATKTRLEDVKKILIGKAQKGLKGERQEEPEPPSEQKAEDTGLEMQSDFEGTMYDMPDDEEGEQNESEDREELDRVMGDFDQNDENVVDEKLWGEDSDDDEDRIDEEKLKFEEDSEVKGEALEDEAYVDHISGLIIITDLIIGGDRALRGAFTRDITIVYSGSSSSLKTSTATPEGKSKS